jgi:hypothetical protein
MALVGKVCPYCGKPGSVLYTTKERIVYQCPNDHQYETRMSKFSIAPSQPGSREKKPNRPSR